MRVLLIGNSNSGKTTLFNKLTSSNERVGNWLGVTVEQKSKTVEIGGVSVEFVDVPGLVSLSTWTNEEARASEIIKNQKFDLIINVVELSNLPQASILMRELKQFKTPVVLFFNFFKEFIKKGGKFDDKTFHRLTNLNYVLGEANEQESIERLKKMILGELSRVYNFDFKLDKSFYSVPQFKINKLDKMLLNSKTSIPLFLISACLFFYLAFGEYGLGAFFANAIKYVGEILILQTEILLLKCNVCSFLTGLICEGIMSGTVSVFVFIPQIAILQFFLISMEQSGIIARISFLFDGYLSKLGLNGRAIFALLTGFGCTAIAVNVSNGLESKTQKRKLINALPFVICSARTPAVMFFAQLAFKNFAWIVLLLAYFVSIVLTVLFLYVQTKLEKSEIIPLILEIPPLRAIKAFNTLKPLKKSVKEFIMKLGIITTLCSAFCYTTNSFTVNFQFISGGLSNESLIASLGDKLSFFFAPLNLSGWQVPTAFLMGVFAKETIVSTLCYCFPQGLILSPQQAVSLIVFSIIYTPCLVSLGSIKKELGIKSAVVVALFQFFVGIFAMYIVYFALTVKFVSKIIISTIVCVVLYFVLSKILKKRKMIAMQKGKI